MSKLQAALDLAEQGYRVFPLNINGKTPAHTGDWKKLATTSPDKVRSLWTDPVFDVVYDFNIGIALDPNTLVVDVDVRDGKTGASSLRTLEAIYDPLPPTREVITASGGRHIYYRVEDSARFPKELATHIDLKGAGGNVVGPGSTIDGRPYVARGEGEGGHVEMAPAWLRDLGNKQRPPAGDRVAAVRADLDQDAAIARAVDWLERSAPAAVEGAGGDAATYRVAARLKDLGISEAAAVDLMLEYWNDDKAHPPWDPSDLADKVANAYRYGQNPPGIRDPETEFEAVDVGNADAISEKLDPAKKRGLYAIRFADAVPELDRPYLIDDIMDVGAMVVTYGDSNVGKTYVVLDQAKAVASGRSWAGHKTAPGLVVYIAAEGGRGFMKRVAALRKDQGLRDIPFSIVPCPIDLYSTGDTGDTNRLIRLVRAEEAHFGQKCVLVVVDTLARAMGGGDENTASDMGVLVRHCDQLRAALGATVNVIHHTGKDAAKGARGSSALRAATDTEIEVVQGKVLVKKQRDMARVEDKHFRLRAVEIGARADGKVVDACVVDWVEPQSFDVPLTDKAAKLWAAFERAESEVAAAQASAGENPDETRQIVTWAQWKAAALVSFPELTNGQYLFEVRGELVSSGRVMQLKRNQWVRR